MTTDRSLRALREASPRNQPGFDEWVGRLATLGEQIPRGPVPVRHRPPRLRSRGRVIGRSAAAATALVAIAVVTLSPLSPPSAYAAAKRAVAATRGAPSGTMTVTVSGGGSSYSLDTIRWNGDAIEVTRGQRSHLVPKYRALLLVGGGAYVQQANGAWLHYATVSSLGKLGPAAQLATDDVAGNTADQILSLATGLTRTTQPGGAAIYTGTIPSSNADPGVATTSDTILRIIAELRGGNEPGAPSGFHDGLHLRMTEGSDGFVRQVSLTYVQQDAGTPAGNGPSTWTITYSRLGSTPPITIPPLSVAAGSGEPSAPATQATIPIGDRLGIAFFAAMHRAYLHTPGVQLTVVSRGSTHAFFGRFLLRLRTGTVVAEAFDGSGGDWNRLVAYLGGPTYAWQPGPSTCWSVVPSSDPRTLTDVGLPYPYPRTGAKTMAPRSNGNHLILATENPDRVWFLATQNVYGRSTKRFVTYTVDARSDQIRSIAIQALGGGNGDLRPHAQPPIRWWTASVRVETLTSAPDLPAPEPTCG